MNDATEREMERLRRLIDQESQAGLGRFHSRDFRPTLEGRLRERLLKKPVFHIRHPAILGLGVAFILLMAALLAVFLPYIEVKREIREIREILMRMPEMGESIASMRLSPMDEETKMRILLTWIFKQADDRLNPREWSAGEMQSLLENAFSVPSPAPVWESHLRALSSMELLQLEKRIRALIAEGELQRRRQRNATDRL